MHPTVELIFGAGIHQECNRILRRRILLRRDRRDWRSDYITVLLFFLRRYVVVETGFHLSSFLGYTWRQGCELLAHSPHPSIASCWFRVQPPLRLVVWRAHLVQELNLILRTRITYIELRICLFNVDWAYDGALRIVTSYCQAVPDRLLSLRIEVHDPPLPDRLASPHRLAILSLVFARKWSSTVCCATLALVGGRHTCQMLASSHSPHIPAILATPVGRHLDLLPILSHFEPPWCDHMPDSCRLTHAPQHVIVILPIAFPAVIRKGTHTFSSPPRSWAATVGPEKLKYRDTNHSSSEAQRASPLRWCLFH
jgi:hypothetical protein